MFVCGFHEALEHQRGLIELLGELLVLVVAPRIGQAVQLAMHHQELIRQLIVELFEIVREAPELGRVHDGLRHLLTPVAVANSFAPEKCTAIQEACK
jgi:hypothetical protein